MTQFPGPGVNDPLNLREVRSLPLLTDTDGEIPTDNRSAFWVGPVLGRLPVVGPSLLFVGCRRVRPFSWSVSMTPPPLTGDYRCLRLST